MFGLHGSMKAVPGKRDELIGHLLAAAEVLGTFEGCYLYMVSADVQDSDRVWVTEAWRSREDHKASLQLEPVRALIRIAGPLLAETPGGTEMIPQGGKGLPGGQGA